MSGISWPRNNFITKELYAPFIVERDTDYLEKLKNKYDVLKHMAKVAGADDESVEIIENYSCAILDAVLDYYKGHISAANEKVKEVVADCINHKYAVSPLIYSEAFKGVKNSELQLYRARTSEDAIPFVEKEMLHIPFNMRGITKNYRFSILGLPCLYLCNTSYGCWLELGRPSEREFNVSPVLVDESLKALNLAVMNRDFTELHDFRKEDVHCWLKLLILMIATSFRIRERGRTFRSEYIVSQSIMLACKELGVDGVVYYSNQTEDHVFASVAINVALLASYEQGCEYSDICRHIKIGKSFNYSFYRQLELIDRQKHHMYELRSIRTGFGQQIGYYDRQYDYMNTEFCEFDRFLFGEWAEKNKIDFGNALV